VAIGIALPLVEFVSTALDFIVECSIIDVIWIAGGTV